MLNKVPNVIKEEIISCLSTYQNEIKSYTYQNIYDVFEIEAMHHKLTIYANEKDCKVYIDGILINMAEMNNKQNVSHILNEARKNFDVTLKKAFLNQD
jgi:hypothetical protein